MIRRRIALTSAAFLIFAIAVATTYWSARHFANPPAGGHTLAIARKWSQEIGLSKKQEEQLKPLDQSLQKDLGSLQVQLAKERMALCTLLRQEPTDKTRLESYIDAVAKLEGQQQRRVVDHLLAMRAILTPEQKDKFFFALMQGICEGCRTSLKSNKDMCGMCDFRKG